jgi:hypothetical protein
MFLKIIFDNGTQVVRRLFLEFRGYYMRRICLNYLMATFHQTSHFLVGFIGEPGGQLQSAANSAMLENGPFTLNLFKQGRH